MLLGGHITNSVSASVSSRNTSLSQSGNPKSRIRIGSFRWSCCTLPVSVWSSRFRGNRSEGSKDYSTQDRESLHRSSGMVKESRGADLTVSYLKQSAY